MLSVVPALLLVLGGAAGIRASGEPIAAPVAAPDHAAFDTLLSRYVDEQGLVRYADWKREDENDLDAYLAELQAIDPASLTDRSEILAFWINLYNALTIDAILHFYPLESIRDKVSALGYNVWKDYEIEIAGEPRSLDEIEHGILRKMGEPRIHFTIVCASLGCPRLRREAYRGDRLDAQLDDAARTFFASKEHLMIDRATNTARLSAILDWFGRDFGRTKEDRLAFIAHHASAADSAFLVSGSARVSYLDYDWRLNEAR